MMSNPNAITIKLDGSLTPSGSSGAPVVNAKGELFGMVVGAGGDRKVVLATSSAAICNRLLKVIPRQPQALQSYFRYQETDKTCRISIKFL